MSWRNRHRLHALLNEYSFNNCEANTEDAAGYLDASGVLAPPCEIGSNVWAYVMSGLEKCKVTNIQYDFIECKWAIFLRTPSGFPACVKRVYSSKEEALNSGISVAKLGRWNNG